MILNSPFFFRDSAFNSIIKGKKLPISNRLFIFFFLFKYLAWQLITWWTFLFLKGTYTYSGANYKAFAPISGSNYNECKEIVLQALKVNEPCPHQNCTFGGIWDGGRGSGQKVLFGTSSFYYVATSVSIISLDKIFFTSSKFQSKLVLVSAFKNDQFSFFIIIIIYETSLIFGLFSRPF